MELGNRQQIDKPLWLRQTIRAGVNYEEIQNHLRHAKLHTVCEQAKCPNIANCFSRNTATFLILGDHCTRNCRFCAINHGPTTQPDPDEPKRVAEAVRALSLRYVVITSVTRDDVQDGGAKHFANTVHEIRRVMPTSLIELLIPDFKGSDEAVRIIVASNPNVINHNVETVPRLYSRVRPGANYDQSLKVLRKLSDLNPKIVTKSGIMLGLGENRKEIEQVMMDLLTAKCRMITIGQYLQPSIEQLPVERYVQPEEFEYWKYIALKRGFDQVASGPFVRSSYLAEELFTQFLTK